MSFRLCCPLALLVACVLAIPLAAAEGDAPPTPAVPAAEAKLPDGVKPYPLTWCATCGPEEEGEELVSRIHKGRQVKLCKGCIATFTADPDGYLKQVDKAVKKAAAGKP